MTVPSKTALILQQKLSLFCALAAAYLLWDILAPQQVLAENAGWWNGNDPGAFKDGLIRNVYCDLLGLIEGNFGGLLTASAGVYAFAMAGIGNVKHSLAALTVALASFSMSAGISVNFGEMCQGGNNGVPAAPAPQGNRTLGSSAVFFSPNALGGSNTEESASEPSSRSDASDPFQNFE